MAVTDLILTWHHVSIRACGSSNYSRFCIQSWGGTLNCIDIDLAGKGAVIPFAITSSVYIGAVDEADLYPHPKM